jgi:group I intron endonuclease
MEEKNSERKWCVYMHINMVNNKVYIGQTGQNPNERWRNGLGYKKDQPAIYRAIQKYGWDNFEHIILQNNLTESEAKEKEKELIQYFHSNDKRYGYNLTDGGEGSAGHRTSEEAKLRISKTLKKIYKNKENHPMFGKNHSEQSKQKMGEMQKQRWTDEMRKELSEKQKERFSNPKNTPWYGKHLSDETKRKLSMIKRIPVVQLDKDDNFIFEYDSIKNASEQTGVQTASIGRCCRRKQKTACGFKWMYKEDYDKLTQQNDLTEEDEI